MILKSRPILALLLISIFIGSCKKDESGDSDLEQIQVVEGGTVYTSQAVNVPIENFSLQEEYSILFGAQQLVAVRSSESSLIFQVPTVARLGETEMVIPDLDGYTVSYEVAQTVLPETPEEVMASFFEDYESNISIFDSQGDKYMEEYAAHLQEYYGGLSAADKQLMAEYYYANQAFFQAVLETGLTGKSKSERLLEGYGAAIVVMGASVAIAIVNPEPITKGLAVAVAILSYKKAYRGYKAFADENIKFLDFAINDNLSLSDKRPTTKKDGTYMTFDDNVEKTVGMQNRARPLIASDKTESAQGISSFFSSFKIMNEVVTKINDAISFVNENLFFSDIGMLTETTITETSTGTTIALDREVFDNLNFSVPGDNISLKEIKLDENNNLNITVEITDPSKVSGEYIDARLDFSYSDTFNGLNGHFPIRVNKFGIEIEGNLDFGDVHISKSISREIAITNPFDEPLKVTDISLPQGFSSDWTSGTIAANGSRSISLTFEPEQEKEYKGTLIVINDLDQKNNTADITGAGVLSEITLNGETEFGDVGIDGDKTLELTITNNGNEDFSLTGNLSLPDGFVPTALQANLAAGASQTVPVRFSPTEEKRYMGEIVINDNFGNRITGIAVSGTGIRNMYFGTWKAISHNNKPMGTQIAQEDEFCDEMQSTYSIDSFQIQLDGDGLTIGFVQNTISYQYTFEIDNNGDPVCSTVEIEGTYPEEDDVFNQTVPYTFESADLIHFNTSFDNGTDIYPTAIEFQGLPNGNLNIIYNTDREDPEYLYFEMVRQ